MSQTIFVVEDESDVLENISEILTENSYNVITATDGREAVIKLQKDIPDLILSDIAMPGMDGLQLLQYTQSSSRLSHIPFVFLTAKSSIQEFRKGMINGADDYLAKPFKASEILEVIELRLKKRKYINDQLNEIKENIAVSVPHELRTPLTPIIGYAGMLKEESGSFNREEVEQMGASILESALRLRTSIEKFILYSSLQYELNPMKTNSSSKSETVKEVDLQIIAAVRNEEKFSERIKDIDMDIDPACIVIGEAFWAICVKELVENAFKFSDTGTSIKITGKAKNNYYEFEIQNSGCILDDEQIRKINILNKQFNPTMPGSGLGLPIVKKIIDYYDGRFEMRCFPESITKVTIVLPTLN